MSRIRTYLIHSFSFIFFFLKKFVVSVEYDDLQGQMVRHDRTDRIYPQSTIADFKLRKRDVGLEKLNLPTSSPESGDIKPACFEGNFN